MNRSSKRFAAIGATIVLASVGVATATMAQGGADSKESSRVGMDTRAVGFPTPKPMETSFVPVKPCRLFDTRNVGGAIASTATRSFKVKGALGSQGGAANCDVPAGATAAAINITAIAAGSPSGYVRGWAAGQPPAQATLLNFSSALSASNSVQLPLCETGACTKDVTLQTFGAAHLIGEVLGYYVPQIHGAVAADARIFNGSTRMLSATREGTGLYRITIDRNIDGCSVAATATGDAHMILAYADGQYVKVHTYGPDGQLKSTSFEFVVAC